MEKVFGLIGATVSHSFSKSYFDEKFFREGLRDYHYELFPLKNISDLETLLKDTKGLAGLNVTIPYKEQVMKYLDEVDGFAKKIGAVNVIKIKDGKLKGYNTDSEAFLEMLEKWLPKDKKMKAEEIQSSHCCYRNQYLILWVNYYCSCVFCAFRGIGE